MYKIQTIIDILEDLAPQSAAAPWDNVGLLLGDKKRSVSSVVLTLDLDQKSLDLAKELEAQLIVCHHPPIFPTIDRLTTDNPLSGRLLEAAEEGIAVYAAHTNLDVAPGGVNDALAAILGLEVIDVIAEADGIVPVQPPLRSEEMRRLLEGRFDIPDVPYGYGRIAEIDEHLLLRTMVRRVNNQLQTGGCILNTDRDLLLERVAVAGGSFDESWIPLLEAKQVDLLIAGEIKHHVLLALADAGIAAIMAGHEATERVVLHPLANYIGLRLPKLRFAVHEGIDYNKIVF